MDIASVASTSFGGYGLLGALGFIGVIFGGIFMYARSNRKKDNLKQEAVTEYKQKVSEEKIATINKTQEKIMDKINEREDIDKTIKRKIDVIVSKAAEEIKEVEKKETVKDVNEFVLDEWDNI